jgi:hypothetical protein
VYAAFPGLPDNFATSAVVGYWRNGFFTQNGVNYGLREFSPTIPRNMTPNQAFKIDTESY